MASDPRMASEEASTSRVQANTVARSAVLLVPLPLLPLQLLLQSLVYMLARRAAVPFARFSGFLGRQWPARWLRKARVRCPHQRSGKHRSRAARGLRREGPRVACCRTSSPCWRRASRRTRTLAPLRAGRLPPAPATPLPLVARVCLCSTCSRLATAVGLSYARVTKWLAKMRALAAAKTLQAEGGVSRPAPSASLAARKAGPGRPKKKKHFPEATRATLRKAFVVNPKPTKEAIAALAVQVELTEVQTKAWFANSRSQVKRGVYRGEVPPMLVQKEASSRGEHAGASAKVDDGEEEGDGEGDQSDSDDEPTPPVERRASPRSSAASGSAPDAKRRKF